MFGLYHVSSQLSPSFDSSSPPSVEFSDEEVLLADIQKAAAEAAEAFRPDQSSQNSNTRQECLEEVTKTTEQGVFYMEEDHEEQVLDIPEQLRNMVLMSPSHCLGYEYEDADLDAHQDTEVSLWSFSI
ncbi:uncharacterized protein HKW66_Vig0119550 [Vigna angularis]|uniref:Uncharacterized protein n=1 Tax=Phaseolus angularis TaxID=3914 RepID=A0A8T0K009_PHAAN|nr:uncharacterized protein HKW66_Vig0119550 [Vigna angularis]